MITAQLEVREIRQGNRRKWSMETEGHDGNGVQGANFRPAFRRVLMSLACGAALTSTRPGSFLS
jgi:hypothetical protein